MSVATAAEAPSLAADHYAITTPNGIEEGGYVPIGGIKQWIQIRGEDRDNPVLLFLHGGPGGSGLARGSLWRTWERSFTVVQWDQRGTGRTFRENGEGEAPQMTINRMVEDGIEVAQYLVTHLHKRQIVLLGGSWGSILGIRMVRLRPDLFCAYVGTGQLVDIRGSRRLNFDHVLQRAIAAHQQAAVEELRKISAEGEPDPEIVAKWASKLPAGTGDPVDHPNYPLPPGISIADMKEIGRGMKFSAQVLYPQIENVNLFREDMTFLVPMFFFQGTADPAAPIELVERYYNSIRAPRKELVRFEGDHHFVSFTRPEKFLAELITRVRPFSVQAVKP